MHWKLKAAIQNLISMLPNELSYSVYYQFQRHFGGLKRVNSSKRLSAGVATWKKILEQGQSPIGKVFFEVGTGRVPIVPLSYWLMGADKVVTIDLNPYLKDELVQESLKWISDNEEEVRNLFGSLLHVERFGGLLNWYRGGNFNVAEFLNLCQIQYIAPGDASKTGLSSKSIDFHTSYTVFEHIPEQILIEILQEGNRIVKNNGLFVHRIDYSDHFSHSDKNISAINFLSFNDKNWKKLAGNRYMYMNRLRHDDFIKIFYQVNHNIIKAETNIDSRIKDILLSKSIRIDEKFNDKSNEILATTGSWMVTRPGHQSI